MESVYALVPSVFFRKIILIINLFTEMGVYSGNNKKDIALTLPTPVPIHICHVNSFLIILDQPQLGEGGQLRWLMVWEMVGSWSGWIGLMVQGRSCGTWSGMCQMTHGFWGGGGSGG